MEYKELIKAVQNEILNLLEETIINNIECMKGSHTAAEISKEVLLSFNLLELEDQNKVEEALSKKKDKRICECGFEPCCPDVHKDLGLGEVE